MNNCNKYKKGNVLSVAMGAILLAAGVGLIVFGFVSRTSNDIPDGIKSLGTVFVVVGILCCGAGFVVIKSGKSVKKEEPPVEEQSTNEEQDEKEQPTSVQYLHVDKDVTEYEIADGVKTIDKLAFNDYIDLEKIKIANKF